MDDRISSLEIAQGLVESVPFLFQQDEVVRAAIAGEVAGEPELERHVETRWSADSAEVVDRYAAAFHQILNAAQAPLPRLGNLQDTSRSAPDRHEAADQCHEQRLISLVVRDVQENGLLTKLRARSHGWERLREVTWLDAECFHQAEPSARVSLGSSSLCRCSAPSVSRSRSPSRRRGS